MRASSCLLLAMLVVGFSSGWAEARHHHKRAAKPAVPDGEVEAHIVRANQNVERKEYAEAVQELAQAYALEPRPLFLFNIGQIHRKAARTREALASYERFLELAPDDPLAVEARGYGADMRKLLAEQEQAAASKVALETQRELTDEQQVALRQKQEALLLEQQRADQAQRTLTMERRTRKPIYKKAWFWTVLGSAVAATSLAVGLGVGLRPPPSPPTDTGYLEIHF